MMNCKQRLENLSKIAIFGQSKDYMPRLKDINVAWIIHIFALLHAVVTLACRHAGLNDELLLTVLTMSMILLICMKRWISIEYAAACVIMANILGYILGHLGADILQSLISTNHAANALATIITTEILGWTIELLTRLFHPRKAGHDEITISSPQTLWLLAAIVVIYIIRIGIVLLFSTEPFSEADIMGASSRVFSNSASLMIMIALNVLYIRWYGSDFKFKRIPQILTLSAFMLAVCLIEVIILGIRSESGLKAAFSYDFPVLFMTSLIAEVTVYCIVYVINYAIEARSEAKEAKGMANIAEYRYFKLKHQVNPHFLFNSLNILDCLVCEEKTEEASIYIHKLAGLYRYMLKTEEEKLVTLREELDFARQYYELLKIRFPKGLIMEVSIPEDSLSRYVVPCSLQLLIENATKHNIVSPTRPLAIHITGSDNKVMVCNEIIPKVSKSPSTGLGLKYMKQQYLDLSGKSVAIEQTDDNFCVTIPLL